jgi:hypothetical protein
MQDRVKYKTVLLLLRLQLPTVLATLIFISIIILCQIDIKTIIEPSFLLVAINTILCFLSIIFIFHILDDQIQFYYIKSSITKPLPILKYYPLILSLQCLTILAIFLFFIFLTVYSDDENIVPLLYGASIIISILAFNYIYKLLITYFNNKSIVIHYKLKMVAILLQVLSILLNSIFMIFLIAFHLQKTR